MKYLPVCLFVFLLTFTNQTPALASLQGDEEESQPLQQRMNQQTGDCNVCSILRDNAMPIIGTLGGFVVGVFFAVSTTHDPWQDFLATVLCGGVGMVLGACCKTYRNQDNIQTLYQSPYHPIG